MSSHDYLVHVYKDDTFLTEAVNLISLMLYARQKTWHQPRPGRVLWQSHRTSIRK